MKNFIPSDFFTENKTTVYARRNVCIEIEGSAISFDPTNTDLSISRIDNGLISIDTDKQALKNVDDVAKDVVKQNKKDAIDSFLAKNSNSTSLVELVDIVKSML